VLTVCCVDEYGDDGVESMREDGFSPHPTGWGKRGRAEWEMDGREVW
jgi:hypothetical protein